MWSSRSGRASLELDVVRAFGRSRAKPGIIDGGSAGVGAGADEEAEPDKEVGEDAGAEEGFVMVIDAGIEPCSWSRACPGTRLRLGT